MKKNIIFIVLLSIAFCASAQKEESLQFGGFANVNHCANKVLFDFREDIGELPKSLPTVGYQFGFLAQYSFSELSKLQFGIGMVQTGSTTGKDRPLGRGPVLFLLEESVHQDLILPILYKRQFNSSSPFYIIGGISPFFKINRRTTSTITLIDGTSIIRTTDNQGALNLKPSLGVGYEIKILKDNYLYLQPNFDIDALTVSSPNACRRYYTIGLTLGILSK